MPITTCPRCARELAWNWEDAFDRFGFRDGACAFLTDTVAGVLAVHGYTVTTRPSASDNTIIWSIQKGKREYVPTRVAAGCTTPRSYLLRSIIALLDRELPGDKSTDAEVVS